MNRRQFIQTTAAAAILGTTTVEAETTQPAKTQAADLAAPPPGVEYFTEERLRKAIDISTPTDGIKFQTVCYTFNPWHPTPFMEKTFGRGWTEYETMRMARPQFPGHYQ